MAEYCVVVEGGHQVFLGVRRSIDKEPSLGWIPLPFQKRTTSLMVVMCFPIRILRGGAVACVKFVQLTVGGLTRHLPSAAK